MNSTIGKTLGKISIYLATLFAFSFAAAQEIPWASSAEEVGMSTQRLERINQAMQRHIDAGNIQGAVTVVARRGKLVHFEAHGLMDVPNNRPMTKDNIFIMMSSTKPVLGVAAMMMIEEGLIRPTDPVSKWIPEFADMQVAVLRDVVDENISPIRVDRNNIPAHRLVPAEREITVHDLLTHTAGLAASGLGSLTSAPISREPGATLATNVPKYGEMNLDFQPGSRWQYSGATGLDVVARIIEIESGMPFDQFVGAHLCASGDEQHLVECIRGISGSRSCNSRSRHVAVFPCAGHNLLLGFLWLE